MLQKLQRNLKCISFFVIILLILLLTDLAILLDIPFLRPILGFIFLTLLPGLLILQILELNMIGSTEKFVLSVGLSISFLMFFGLLISNLSLYMGYGTPLSTISLLISFNIAFMVLAIVGYKVNKEPIFSIPDLNLNISEKAFLIVPILFPALCIFGTHLMNTTDNNIILMFLLFSIPIYVVFVSFFNHKFPERLYPVVIFSIGISLLLMFSLRSNHIIIGSDTGREFYFFGMMSNNQHWSILGNNILETCLSISLLPTIYYYVLNVDKEFLFKILYSLIFSVSPLAIYLLCKKYIGCYYSFLASFFPMTTHYFQWAASLARISTATVFFALAIMVIFNDKIDALKKRILFIIFAMSIIVSHYATTYIFFFMLLFTWFGMQIVPTIGSRKKKSVALFKNPLKTNIPPFSTSGRESTAISDTDVPKTTPISLKFPHIRGGITLTTVTLFFAMLFFWYSQLTGEAFNAGVGFIQTTILNLNKFFIMESRASTTSNLFGVNILSKEIVEIISVVSTWTIIVCIAIGVFSMIYRYKAILKGKINAKSKFLKTDIEIDYILFALASSILLVTMVVLPYVAKGYDIGRLFLMTIVILSLAFIMGAITISKYLKVRASMLILLVLIIHFMCGTGIMSQISGDPQAITLNSYGETYNEGAIINDQDCCSSKWIANYVDQKEWIHTTNYAFDVLPSQGLISPSRIDRYLIPKYEKDKRCDGYVYLRYQSVANREMTVYYPSGKTEKHSIGEYSHLLIKKNKIYVNGDSVVYS